MLSNPLLDRLPPAPGRRFTKKLPSVGASKLTTFETVGLPFAPPWGIGIATAHTLGKPARQRELPESAGAPEGHGGDSRELGSRAHRTRGGPGPGLSQKPFLIMNFNKSATRLL